MSDFAGINRGLKDLFAPSSVPTGTPSQLSDDVQLTHDIFGPLHTMADVRQIELNGGAANNTVSTGTVPADRVWWVLACDLSHNDPTDRILSIRIDRAVPAISVPVAGLTSGSVSSGHLLQVGRGLIVPPGFFLKGVASVIAATFLLNIRVLHLELTLADVTP